MPVKITSIDPQSTATPGNVRLSFDPAVIQGLKDLLTKVAKDTSQWAPITESRINELISAVQENPSKAALHNLNSFVDNLAASAPYNVQSSGGDLAAVKKDLGKLKTAVNYLGENIGSSIASESPSALPSPQDEEGIAPINQQIEGPKTERVTKGLKPFEERQERNRKQLEKLEKYSPVARFNEQKQRGEFKDLPTVKTDKFIERTFKDQIPPEQLKALVKQIKKDPYNADGIIDTWMTEHGDQTQYFGHVPYKISDANKQLLRQLPEKVIEEYEEPIKAHEAEVRELHADNEKLQKKEALLEEELIAEEVFNTKKAELDSMKSEPGAALDDLYRAESELKKAKRTVEKVKAEQKNLEKPSALDRKVKQFNDEEYAKEAENIPGDANLKGASLLYSGQPMWYAKEMRNIVERAKNELAPGEKAPYIRYNGQRLATDSAGEAAARSGLINLLNPKSHEATSEQLKKLQGLDPNNEQAKKDITESETVAKEKLIPSNLEEYVNPQSNSMLDLIKKRMTRNYEEKIKPHINSNFIGKSAWLNGKRVDAQNKADREFQEDLADRETQFLYDAYNKAESTASNDKQRVLNFMLNKANLERNKLHDVIDVTNSVSGLEDDLHKQKLFDIEALAKMGKAERDREQQDLNLQQSDFEKEKNFELEKVEKLRNLMAGLPTGTIEASSNPLAPERDNSVLPSQQGAQLAASFLDRTLANKAFERQGRAHGGLIQTKANGGMIEQLEQKYLDNLLQNAQTPPTPNPWMTYASGLLRNFAGSQNPNPLGALVEGAVGGNEEVDRQNAIAKAEAAQRRNLEQSEIKSLLDFKTNQADKNWEKDFKNRELEATIAHHRAIEANAHEKKSSNPNKIVKVDNKYMREVIEDNPETGEQEVRLEEVPMSFINGKDIPPDQRKKNNEFLEEDKDAAQGARQAQLNLDKLDKAFKRLDTSTYFFNEPGSIVSQGAENDFTKAAFYNREAQAAMQEIEKLNSDTIVELQKTLPARFISVTGTKLEQKTLPTAKMQPEARNAIVNNIAFRNSSLVAFGTFSEEFMKKNNGDRAGLERAFNHYWEENSKSLLDGKNRLKKGAEDKIENYVDQLLSSGGKVEKSKDTDYTYDEVMRRLKNRATQGDEAAQEFLR